MSNPYIVRYTGNGSNRDFQVPATYIRQAHVSVSVAGVITSDYVWLTSSIIRLDVAPGNGVEVVIIDQAPGEVLNIYSGSTGLSALSLNENFKQSVQLADFAFNAAKDIVDGNIPAGTITGDMLVDGAVTEVKTSAGVQASLAKADSASVVGGFKNLLINGNQHINQRGYVSGAATSGANQYTIDRWRVVASGQNLSWTVSSGTYTYTAPAGGVEQVIEGASNLGGQHTLNWTGTATATVNGNGVAKGAQVTPTGNNNITVRFSGGTFSLPQLEPGPAATPFERRPIGAELALCQRYFEAGGRARFSGDVTTGASYEVSNFFKVTKRAQPTVVLTNINAFRFPTTSGSVIDSTTSGFSEARDCNQTGAGARFASTYTADSEL